MGILQSSFNTPSGFVDLEILSGNVGAVAGNAVPDAEFDIIDISDIEINSGDITSGSNGIDLIERMGNVTIDCSDYLSNNSRLYATLANIINNDFDYLTLKLTIDNDYLGVTSTYFLIYREGLEYSEDDNLCKIKAVVKPKSSSASYNEETEDYSFKIGDSNGYDISLKDIASKTYLSGRTKITKSSVTNPNYPNSVSYQYLHKVSSAYDFIKGYFKDILNTTNVFLYGSLRPSESNDTAIGGGGSGGGAGDGIRLPNYKSAVSDTVLSGTDEPFIRDLSNNKSDYDMFISHGYVDSFNQSKANEDFDFVNYRAVDILNRLASIEGSYFGSIFGIGYYINRGSTEGNEVNLSYDDILDISIESSSRKVGSVSNVVRPLSRSLQEPNINGDVSSRKVIKENEQEFESKSFLLHTILGRVNNSWEVEVDYPNPNDQNDTFEEATRAFYSGLTHVGALGYANMLDLTVAQNIKVQVSGIHRVMPWNTVTFDTDARFPNFNLLDQNGDKIKFRPYKFKFNLLEDTVEMELYPILIEGQSAYIEDDLIADSGIVEDQNIDFVGGSVNVQSDSYGGLRAEEQSYIVGRVSWENVRVYFLDGSSIYVEDGEWNTQDDGNTFGNPNDGFSWESWGEPIVFYLDTSGEFNVIKWMPRTVWLFSNASTDTDNIRLFTASKDSETKVTSEKTKLSFESYATALKAVEKSKLVIEDMEGSISFNELDGGIVNILWRDIFCFTSDNEFFTVDDGSIDLDKKILPVVFFVDLETQSIDYVTREFWLSVNSFRDEERYCKIFTIYKNRNEDSDEEPSGESFYIEPEDVSRDLFSSREADREAVLNEIIAGFRANSVFNIGQDYDGETNTLTVSSTMPLRTSLPIGTRLLIVSATESFKVVVSETVEAGATSVPIVNNRISVDKGAKVLFDNAYYQSQLLVQPDKVRTFTESVDRKASTAITQSSSNLGSIVNIRSTLYGEDGDVSSGLLFRVNQSIARAVLTTNAFGNLALISLESGEEVSEAKIKADKIIFEGQGVFVDAVNASIRNGSIPIKEGNNIYSFNSDTLKRLPIPADLEVEEFKDGDMLLDEARGNLPYTWKGSEWARAYSILNGGDFETESIDANKLKINSAVRLKTGGKFVAGGTSEGDPRVELSSNGLIANDGEEDVFRLPVGGGFELLKGSIKASEFQLYNGGSIRTSTTANRGVVITNEGIKQYTETGELSVHLPSDGTFPKLSGIIGSSIIDGNISISENGKISIGNTLNINKDRISFDNSSMSRLGVSVGEALHYSGGLLIGNYTQFASGVCNISTVNNGDFQFVVMNNNLGKMDLINSNGLRMNGRDAVRSFSGTPNYIEIVDGVVVDIN